MRFAALCLASLFVLSVLPTGQAEEKKPVEVKQSPVNQSVVRIYRVADLLARQNPKQENGEQAEHGPYTAEEFYPLLKFIETKIAPGTWESSRRVGGGTMAPYAQNGSIVIRQSIEVHDQISLELGKLREAYRVLDEFEQIKNAPDFPVF